MYAYMLANTIMKEVAITLENSDDSSQLGRVRAWTNGLPDKLLTKSSDLFGAIAGSTLCHTANVKELVGDARCQCGGVKYLKCSLMSLSLPLFFWGCVQYRTTKRF